MFAACVALAVLIAFSLKNFVPVGAEATRLESNLPSPDQLQTPVGAQVQDTTEVAESSTLQEESGVKDAPLLSQAPQQETQRDSGNSDSGNSDVTQPELSPRSNPATDQTGPQSGIVTATDNPAQSDAGQAVEGAADVVTLERIPRSSQANGTGPVDVAGGETAKLEPLSLGLNAQAGKVLVSGKLPRSRFASVLLQVLRSAAPQPLDARELELIAEDARDTPWVFDVAKAFGSVDLEFATLDLQSDGKTVTVSGDVSTIAEKQTFLNALEGEGALVLSEDSQILVVPVQDATLLVSYANNEYEISGTLAIDHRDLYQRSISGRAISNEDVRWRRKVGNLEIVDSLSVILDIMDKSLLSARLTAESGNIALSGIVPSTENAESNQAGATDQEAVRRNIIAVFSSVLPEAETLTTDLRIAESPRSAESVAGQSLDVEPDETLAGSDQLQAAESSGSSADVVNESATAEDLPAETDASIEQASAAENATRISEVLEVPETPVAEEVTTAVVTPVEPQVGSPDTESQQLAVVESADDSALAEPADDLQDELTIATAELETLFEGFGFVPGETQLSDQNTEILDQLFEVLFLFPSLKANLGVDVADLSRSVANLALSRERANEISTYVTGLGVESYRLTVAGYGDSRRVGAKPGQSRVTLDFSRIP